MPVLGNGSQGFLVGFDGQLGSRAAIRPQGIQVGIGIPIQDKTTDGKHQAVLRVPAFAWSADCRASISLSSRSLSFESRREEYAWMRASSASARALPGSTTASLLVGGNGSRQVTHLEGGFSPSRMKELIQRVGEPVG